MEKSRLLLLFLTVFIFKISYSLDLNKEYLLVYFKDKKNIQQDDIHLYLSEKSIQRRIQQQLVFDSLDYPVYQGYIDSLSLNGYEIIHQSKWLNAALIAVPLKDLNHTFHALKGDYIQKIDFLGGKSKLEEYEDIESTIPKSKVVRQHRSIRKMIGLDTLHRLGYKGKSIDIAIIDAGFSGVNQLEAFQHLYQNHQIKGTVDFTEESENVYTSSDHGTKVLSIISSQYKNSNVGGAPNANFWLLKTENVYYEHPIEEFYYVKALEYCDSVGIDIINTSLGYYYFDHNKYDYINFQLYQNRAISSKAASIAASRGMVVVVSAGNEGEYPWKEVTLPADADHIIAVAATTLKGASTHYGSVGRKYPYAPRPNIAVPGHKIYAVDQYGQYTLVQGSSFAAPYISAAIACLWQKYPSMTAYQMMHYIETSGAQFPYTQPKTGYGIPDLKKILRILDN